MTESTHIEYVEEAKTEKWEKENSRAFVYRSFFLAVYRHRRKSPTKTSKQGKVRDVSISEEIEACRPRVLCVTVDVSFHHDYTRQCW